MDEFFKLITETNTLSIILIVFAALLLACIIWLIVLSVKHAHLKEKFYDHVRTMEIKKFLDQPSVAKEEPVEESVKAVILEPEVEPEDYSDHGEVAAEEFDDSDMSEDECEVVVTPRIPVKRNTTGMMKLTFVQLTRVAEVLGSKKSWKNKSEIVDAIKLIINSKKCTKGQILDVLDLDFLYDKLSEVERKNLKSKKKDALLDLLDSILRK